MQTPVMDRVHAFLFSKKLGTRRFGPDTLRVMAKHRTQLRRAEKFVLDDDSVRLICHLSHEKARLEAWSFLARLPFEVCWLEFNLHAKVDEFNKMGGLSKPFNPDEVSPSVGYLLYRDDAGAQSPRWVVTQFYEVAGETLPGLLSYVFDPEGGDYAPVRGSTYWRSPTLSLIPGFPKLPIVADIAALEISTTCDAEILATGDMRLAWQDADENNELGIVIPAGTPYETAADGRMIFHADDKDIITGGDWARSRMAIIPEPWWQSFRKPTVATLATEVREEMGHIRYIVTMLAALNSIPRDVKEAQTLTGKRHIGGNILPYFQHRTVTLRVPNDDRIVWARKRIDSEFRNAPRPWHRVKGHWRIIERGKAPSHICRHQPTMVESGVGMCEKCQLMIRWINDHTRGDPELGIVEHTYSVKGKKAK